MRGWLFRGAPHPKILPPPMNRIVQLLRAAHPGCDGVTLDDGIVYSFSSGFLGKRPVDEDAWFSEVLRRASPPATTWCRPLPMVSTWPM